MCDRRYRTLSALSAVKPGYSFSPSTGKIGWSGTQYDSKPNSSARFATIAGSAPEDGIDENTPISIGKLLCT
jgi:hypothetical protein